jgi:ATP-dependent exoDNAse (exonuclease V) alpha subunit
MSTISPSRFAAIIAAARLKAEAAKSQPIAEPTQESSPLFSPELAPAPTRENTSVTDKYGNSITYNSAQQSFIDLASTHKSCCLIGAAGTGKTTCMKGTVQSLTQSSKTGILQNHDHKYLPHGAPGIVVCAYTRRATNNIRRNMDESMKANCITIHKLLEYGPEYFTIIDDNGNEKTSMRFVPMRNASNPLPSEITTIIFEESSMISTPLYNEVIDSIQNPNIQIIFLGDIQQLPPVFGPAILGFKLSELPTIELTEVYRQALESPIIRLAHRILSGKPISPEELPNWNVPNLTIKPWKKKIEAEAALSVSEKLFDTLYERGEYDPENDIILIPFNKSYGTLEINKSIANHLARKKELVTWEVVSGFIKHYFSVGDKVLYDREDAIILDIYPNPTYTGVSPQRESTYLDYWGHNNEPKNHDRTINESESGEDIDFLLAQVSASDSDEDRVTQSSHHIKLRMQDSDTEKTITKAAEVNALILGYALTVHKSQGSEWDKVFLLFHNSHATMMQRELLYTAVTRAKKELFIICEQDTFTTAVKSQRIKGNTLLEKAEYFKGKLDKGDLQS